MVDNPAFATPRCEPIKVYFVSDILEVSNLQIYNVPN